MLICMWCELAILYRHTGYIYVYVRIYIHWTIGVNWLNMHTNDHVYVYGTLRSCMEQYSGIFQTVMHTLYITFCGTVILIRTYIVCTCMFAILLFCESIIVCWMTFCENVTYASPFTLLVIMYVHTCM